MEQITLWTEKMYSCFEENDWNDEIKKVLVGKVNICYLDIDQRK